MTKLDKALALSAERRKRTQEVIRSYTPALDELSARMRASAESHRDFDVGVVSLAWGRQRDPIVIGGANYKPHGGERRHRSGDYCGEMENIWCATRMQCDEIIIMVVTCPHQPDQQSNQDFGVTVSCYFCRVEFRAELLKPKSPLKPHTILRFNHPADRSIHFEKTVAEFLALFPHDPPWVPKRGGT